MSRAALPHYQPGREGEAGERPVAPVPLGGDDGEGGDLAFYGRLTLEWGLRFTRMQQEWAAWAAEHIGDRASRDTARP
ncbi:hypothetical protein ACFYWP_22210 [Actinacidiphila glaucinigra]|uniref:hypothetical protein n=1 Tax=Actinacidiphila glaucinigra TaxID=235986 RepID=UPI0036B217D2